MLLISEEYRSTIINMLVRLMGADGRRDRNEFAFLLHVVQDLGMSLDDLIALSPKIFSEELVLPTQERDRMIILYYLLVMINTDGVVSIEEENMIRDFGHQLGFRIELVTSLVQMVKTLPPFMLPTDELLAQIRRYLN